MKYLTLYKKLCKLGKLEHGFGLCCEIQKNGGDYDAASDMITEDDYEFRVYDKFYGYVDPEGLFSDTRKNMLLLLAAENNEL